MFKLAKPFYFRTISSLHCGSGNDLGIVDLPIQRERHTSFPKVESSSLKGAIREAFESKLQTDKENFLKKITDINSLNDFNGKLILHFDYALQLVFGYDSDGLDDGLKSKFEDTEFSGALAFSDARLLFFPVKSAKGVFAWITCPYVLKRFLDDMNLCGLEPKFTAPVVNIGEYMTIANNKVSINKSVILEEYTFTEKQDLKIDQLIDIFPDLNELKDRIVVLNDDDFKDFVNQSTEVITRTKIDNATGAVAKGALFNEEYLPPETIMYFMVFASQIFQKENKKKGIFKENGKREEELVMQFFEDNIPEIMQLGGNATIGKGIVKMKRINFNSNNSGGK